MAILLHAWSTAIDEQAVPISVGFLTPSIAFVTSVKFWDERITCVEGKQKENKVLVDPVSRAKKVGSSPCRKPPRAPVRTAPQGCVESGGLAVFRSQFPQSCGCWPLSVAAHWLDTCSQQQGIHVIPLDLSSIFCHQVFQ